MRTRILGFLNFNRPPSIMTILKKSMDTTVLVHRYTCTYFITFLRNWIVQLLVDSINEPILILILPVSTIYRSKSCDNYRVPLGRNLLWNVLVEFQTRNFQVFERKTKFVWGEREGRSIFVHRCKNWKLEKWPSSRQHSYNYSKHTSSPHNNGLQCFSQVDSHPFRKTKQKTYNAGIFVGKNYSISTSQNFKFLSTTVYYKYYYYIFFWIHDTSAPIKKCTLFIIMEPIWRV